jgi:hypothetical protein
MSTIETTTTSLQRPEPEYFTDEAQLAAAAFLALQRPDARRLPPGPPRLPLVSGARSDSAPP